METITEDYVSFETTKLLKEKGFNGACWSWYHNGNHTFTGTSRYCNNELDKHDYSKPTQQMAMKWLREKYNLFIQIEFDPPVFSADIYKMDEIDEYGGAKHIPPTFANAKSYESACEAALKYSLENLI